MRLAALLLAGCVGSVSTSSGGGPGKDGAVDGTQVIDMVTMQNGNFWTSTALAFPVTVLASDCPSAVKMNAGAANGHCNANGCHPGGTSSQMHLP